MKPVLISLVAALVMILTPQSANAQNNLINNGSFEDNGGSFSGWTLINTVGYFNSPSIGPDEIGDGTNIPEGSHFAEFLPESFGNGQLSQTFSTTPGAFYTVSLSAIQFFGTNAASVSMLAGSFVDNGRGQPPATLLSTLNFTTPTFPPGPSTSLDGGLFNSIWQDFSFTFQAPSNVTTLFFDYYRDQRSILPPGGNPPDTYFGAGGFDNISVVLAPEPSIVALFGLGLAGWLAYGWRRRIKPGKGL